MSHLEPSRDQFLANSSREKKMSAELRLGSTYFLKVCKFVIDLSYLAIIVFKLSLCELSRNSCKPLLGGFKQRARLFLSL